MSGASMGLLFAGGGVFLWGLSRLMLAVGKLCKRRK